MVSRRPDPFDGADVAALWARVLARIDVTPDGCWLWLGALNADGYGCIRTGTGGGRGGVGRVHRLAVIVRDGVILDGHEVDHACHYSGLCHVNPCPHRRCVNPDHLEQVTHGDNMRRQYEDGRCTRGHALTLRPDGQRRECLTCKESPRYSRGRTVTPGPLDRPLFEWAGGPALEGGEARGGPTRPPPEADPRPVDK